MTGTTQSSRRSSPRIVGPEAFSPWMKAFADLLSLCRVEPDAGKDFDPGTRLAPVKRRALLLLGAVTD